ncbi:MAG: MFS transporter [Cohaesibacter sp.]|nr:MFS transporter [Cohaesibacter sp.]
MMLLASESQNSSSKAAQITVAIVFTAYMAVVFGLGLYLFSLLASEMREDIGFGYQMIGLVTASAQVSFLIAAILCSRLVDLFGEGVVIVTAVIFASGLLSAMALAKDVTVMALLITVLGACAAFMVVPTVGVISRIIAFEYRARVNGLLSSGTAYGQLAAGAIAPLLVFEYGWRAVWLSLGLGALILSIFGALALKRLVPDVFTKSHHQKQILKQRYVKITSLFSRTNLTLWALLGASGMACGPWQNYLSTFLSEEFGYSIDIVGGLWSIIGFLGLFSGFVMGSLADRIGIRQALVLSYGLVGLSAFLIVTHDNQTLLYMAAVCFGLAFFAVYGLIPAYISKTVSAKSAIPVFAVANICLGIGTALGNLGAGYSPVLAGSFQQLYFGIMIITCLAAILTLTLPDEHMHSKHDQSDCRVNCD